MPVTCNEKRKLGETGGKKETQEQEEENPFDVTFDVARAGARLLASLNAAPSPLSSEESAGRVSGGQGGLFRGPEIERDRLRLCNNWLRTGPLKQQL